MGLGLWSLDCGINVKAHQGYAVRAMWLGLGLGIRIKVRVSVSAPL